MKTAVSLPDELFQRAELEAKKSQVTRSELYQQALTDFLKSRDDEAIGRKFREVYSKTPAKVDEAIHRAQLDVMKRSEW